LAEPLKKETAPQQNEKDIVEIVEEKNVDSSSSSSDESSSNEESKYYMILSLWPDGTYSIIYKAYYEMEESHMYETEVAPMLYGNFPLNDDDPITLWLYFLKMKFGEDNLQDDEMNRAVYEFTVFFEAEDTENDFYNAVKAYAIKTFGRDTKI
jgi:hypothetical protein